MPKQQPLKSPLLLCITGGVIPHPAFYSYLPRGLLVLCSRECASALPLYLPQDELGCVSASGLVARHDLCMFVWEHVCAAGAYKYAAATL